MCAACIFHCLHCKLTSVGSFISALREWHVAHGCGDLPRGELYTRVQKGLKNSFGLADHTVPKQAFTMQDLADIHARMQPRSFADARDWSMLTVAFFGLLRISEYCDGGLRMENVALHDWGFKLTIPHSKTSTHPVDICVVARGDKDDLCPARALRAYLALIHPLHLRSPLTPLFLKHPLMSAGVTAESFTQRIHVFAAVLGKNSKLYAGHSLRRGGATALYIAGVPEAIIQQHGRWKSLAVRGYLEASVYHQMIPSMLLLKKSAGLFPVTQPDGHAAAGIPLLQITAI